MFNIDLIVIHVPGASNQIADFLSRWTSTFDPEYKLRQLLPNIYLINTLIYFTKLYYDI